MSTSTMSRDALSAPREGPQDWVTKIDVGGLCTFLLVLPPFASSTATRGYLSVVAVMYAVSALTHAQPGFAWCRVLDHVMIGLVVVATALPFWTPNGLFVLPFPLFAGEGTWWIVLGSMAIVAVVAKLCTFMSRWWSGAFYCFLGLPMVCHFLLESDQIPLFWRTVWLLGLALFIAQLGVYTLKTDICLLGKKVHYTIVQHVLLFFATLSHGTFAVFYAG